MKTEKNRKRQGSVLLTVVFVMSILIVFLFGTMALAMAANNRAHVNYSSAQTGITARAVAESAIKAISDKTPQGVAYSNAIESLDPGESVTVDVQLSGDNANYNTMGHVDAVEISYAGTKKYYDANTAKWEERDVLKFTSTVTMSGVTSSSSVYVLKHERDDSEETEKDGAGFVTIAGASLPSQASILGGAYIDLPTLADAWKYNDLKNLDTNKTFVAFDPTDAENTSFHLQNTGAMASCDLYINDNFHLNQLGALYIPSTGKGVTVWGDMITEKAADDLVFTASDDVREYKFIPGGANKTLNFNRIPYVFVNGNIRGKAIKLGDINDPFPLNVFCGTITHDAVAANEDLMAIAGDVYCMDEGEWSIIKGHSDTNLKAWTASVINRAKSSSPVETTAGNVYTKGHLDLSNITITGNVMVEGDCHIGNGVSIDGKLVVGGQLTADAGDDIDDIDGGVYCDDADIPSKGKVVAVASKEVNNLIGYYYVYVPQADEDGVYHDPFGDEIGSEGIVGYDTKIEDAGNMYYTLQYGIDPSVTIITAENAKDYIDTYYEPIFENAAVNGGIEFQIPGEDAFYIETLVDEANVVYDPATKTLNSVPVYADPAYIKTKEEKFTYTRYEPEPTAPVHTLSEYRQISGEITIYPRYAEKKVILGLDTTLVRDPNTGDPLQKKDTQIVKTMYDVMKDVANPWEYDIDLDNPSTLPKKIRDIYLNEIKDKAEAEVTSANILSKFTKSGDTIKIDKSCRIDLGSYVNWEGKNEPFSLSDNLLIDPGPNELVIIVKNLGLQNGKSFLVDDSQGGKVHMIIEDGGKFVHAGGNNGIILTTTYKELLIDHIKGTFLKYNSPNTAGGYDLKELGQRAKPGLYIYGEENSEFVYSNFSVLTANILSPNLTVNVAATSGHDKVKELDFYYNDINISKTRNNGGELNAIDSANQLLIGCLNSRNADLPNMLHVVHVTSGGAHGGSGDAESEDFWYRIMYYDEF